MGRTIRDQSQFAHQPCPMQSTISTVSCSCQAHRLSAFAGFSLPLWSNEKACRYPMRLPDAWLSYRCCKHFLGAITSSFCCAFHASGSRGGACGMETRLEMKHTQQVRYSSICCYIPTYSSEYQSCWREVYENLPSKHNKPSCNNSAILMQRA